MTQAPARLRTALAAALVTISLAAPPATAPAAGLRTTPVIPPLNGVTGEHARAIFSAGLALGNEADVFAKVGDSISESGSYLQDLACEDPAWGRWAALEETGGFYGLHTFPSGYTSVYCGHANSFSRASATAVAGWDAADALAVPMHDPPAGAPGSARSPASTGCCTRASPWSCTGPTTSRASPPMPMRQT